MYITEEERKILEFLCDAYNKWCELEREHPDEERDFADAIHRLQELVAMRVARKAEPSVFTTIPLEHEATSIKEEHQFYSKNPYSTDLEK